MRDVRQLYVLREANSPVGTIEHRMLCSARRQLAALTVVLDRIFFISVFLVGGVVLSALAERRGATNLGMCVRRRGTAPAAGRDDHRAKMPEQGRRGPIGHWHASHADR